MDLNAAVSPLKRLNQWFKVQLTTGESDLDPGVNLKIHPRVKVMKLSGKFICSILRPPVSDRHVIYARHVICRTLT